MRNMKKRKRKERRQTKEENRDMKEEINRQDKGKNLKNGGQRKVLPL
jgi:hypothetical protein